MTTHEQLVQDTAEKMKAHDDATLNEGTRLHYYLPLARIAVAMKAEGFDEGVQAGYMHTASDEDNTWNLSLDTDTIASIKQSLGLTKPTDNDK